jgi:hypothetical protein
MIKLFPLKKMLLNQHKVHITLFFSKWIKRAINFMVVFFFFISLSFNKYFLWYSTLYFSIFSCNVFNRSGIGCTWAMRLPSVSKLRNPYYVLRKSRKVKLKTTKSAVELWIHIYFLSSISLCFFFFLYIPWNIIMYVRTGAIKVALEIQSFLNRMCGIPNVGFVQ